MSEKELNPTKIEEVSDLVYSIRNLCNIFDLVRDVAPNSLILLPTIMEEIFVKAQSLLDYCEIKESDVLSNTVNSG